MDGPKLEPLKYPMQSARRVLQSALQKTGVLDLRGEEGYPMPVMARILSTMTSLTKPLGLLSINLPGRETTFAPGYPEFAIFSHCTSHHPP